MSPQRRPRDPKLAGVDVHGPGPADPSREDPGHERRPAVRADRRPREHVELDAGLDEVDREEPHGRGPHAEEPAEDRVALLPAPDLPGLVRRAARRGALLVEVVHVAEEGPPRALELAGVLLRAGLEADRPALALPGRPQEPEEPAVPPRARPRDRQREPVEVPEAYGVLADLAEDAHVVRRPAPLGMPRRPFPAQDQLVERRVQRRVAALGEQPEERRRQHDRRQDAVGGRLLADEVFRRYSAPVDAHAGSPPARSRWDGPAGGGESVSREARC